MTMTNLRQASLKPRAAADPAVSPAPARILDRVAPVLIVAAALAIGLAFWAANGTGVFAEMLSSAWSLCF